MPALPSAGFRIHRKIIAPASLEALRTEADRLATTVGTPCVRHIRGKSRLFESLATSPQLQALLPPGLQPVRSILFDKTPAQNWPVAWHQDLTIAVGPQAELTDYGPWSIKDGAVHVQPPVSLLESMLTLRLHLDDTPATNGALRVIPGSHRHGKNPPPHTDQDAFTCDCRAGDILAMSPLILHASSRCQSPCRRRILHFEYAPPGALDARLHWHELG